jgi:hypothetical protein
MVAHGAGACLLQSVACPQTIKLSCQLLHCCARSLLPGPLPPLTLLTPTPLLTARPQPGSIEQLQLAAALQLLGSWLQLVGSSSRPTDVMAVLGAAVEAVCDEEGQPLRGALPCGVLRRCAGCSWVGQWEAAADCSCWLLSCGCALDDILLDLACLHVDPCD